MVTSESLSIAGWELHLRIGADNQLVQQSECHLLAGTDPHSSPSIMVCTLVAGRLECIG